MNPEFQRNLWLNLSPTRLIMMPVVLGTVFLAASVAPDEFGLVPQIAQTGFFFIVIIWGTWLAARAVVGEIRDRTWDGQRMSAIAPWSMVWGKLFGTTVFVWYGGLICLVVMFQGISAQYGPSEALNQVGLYATAGIFGHAVALLTSLLAVRRQSRHPRIEVFLHQIAGIGGAALVFSLWPGNWPDGFDVNLRWYGMTVEVRSFFFISLLTFIVWALIGNYRQMRQELQYSNSALVWLAFMAYAMIYAAGFVDGQTLAMVRSEMNEDLQNLPIVDPALMRLVVANLVAAVLAYIMLFLDDKDIVTLRWIAGRIGSGQLVSGLSRVPSWAWSVAASGVLVLLIMILGRPIALDARVASEAADVGFVSNNAADWRLFVLAGFFFLLRDTGIVLFFKTGRRSRGSDFWALITLAVLYVVMPVIISGFNLGGLMPLFLPYTLQLSWVTVFFPLMAAGVIWSVVITRIASRS